ncbi:MAG: sigma-54 dependent transcriptional regulator [Bacteroidia bacterium]|nr:sigma-54 dependent transcriptional regulator [Bacteroidia bacterium]
MAETLVFIVDDEDSVRRLISQRISKSWGFKTRAFSSGESVLEALDDAPDAIILDIFLPEEDGVEVLREIKKQNPDIPVIMLSAEGAVDTVVECIKLGAADFLVKPIDFTHLEVTLKNAVKLSVLSKELARLRDALEESVSTGTMIAGSKEMQLVERMIGRVKDTDMSVLLSGESGTGKELVARLIHFTGKRKRGPFVVFNCAAIPADLLESELFGHERGAFTGATQRKIGKFEQADGGTIFLDEIGDMSPALQAKILRVIASKEFERVGGNTTIKTNARVISASNKNLKDAVKKKLFREDLYYRLSSFPIHLPALRDRGSDIIELAEMFLKQFSKEMNLPVSGFSREAIEVIYRYPWPGNVRELENAIRRAVVMAEGDVISANELPLVAQPFQHSSMEIEVDGKIFHDNKIVPLEKIKEQVVRRAIEITRGNLAQTARALGVSRSTLYKLAEKYKVKY